MRTFPRFFVALTAVIGLLSLCAPNAFSAPETGDVSSAASPAPVSSPSTSSSGSMSPSAGGDLTAVTAAAPPPPADKPGDKAADKFATARGTTPGTTAGTRSSIKDFFEMFKRLDLSNNPAVLELYSADATFIINGLPVPREAYNHLVLQGYELAPELNASTKYSNVVFDNETADTAHATLTASAVDQKVNVEWNLRRDAQGDWVIINERTVLLP